MSSFYVHQHRPPLLAVWSEFREMTGPLAEFLESLFGLNLPIVPKTQEMAGSQASVDQSITSMLVGEMAGDKAGPDFGCLDARPPWRQQRPGGLAAKRLNRAVCSAGWPASAR